MAEFNKKTLNYQITEAFFAADIAPMSKHKAAQILAYIHQYGGEHQNILFSRKAQSDRYAAQKIANVYGGAIPDPETAELFKKYNADIEESYYSGGQFLDWVIELGGAYGITHKQGANFIKVKNIKKQ